MFKNKAENNKHNISGAKIATLRKQLTPKVSQRALAEQMQLLGLDLNKNAIQRIESGRRFVTDIELKTFAAYFQVTTDELLNHNK